jgi:hypothetical protein
VGARRDSLAQAMNQFALERDIPTDPIEHST